MNPYHKYYLIWGILAIGIFIFFLVTQFSPQFTINTLGFPISFTYDDVNGFQWYTQILFGVGVVWFFGFCIMSAFGILVLLSNAARPYKE